MKMVVAFLAISLMSISFSFGQAKTKNIEINLTGIEEIEGQIMVLLFDKKEHFPKDQKLAKQFKFPVTGKTMKVVLKDLPEQDYAIMLYHDQDRNEVCNQNKIGYPLERIGFSNNLKPKLKAPKFEDAKITINQTSIAIQLYKM